MAGTDLRHRVAGYGRRLVTGPGRRFGEGFRVLLQVGHVWVGRAGGVTVRAVARRWRGSLQLRIVSITLVSSATLVAGFGFVIAERITDGLVDAKVNDALSQMKSAQDQALQQLSGVGPNDSELARTAKSLINDLAGVAGPAGEFQVVLETDPRIRTLDVVAEPWGAEQWVPGALRSEVESSR
ncbi:MAG TPA: hypothetical protein VHJ83_00600, partial [Micromonosporaceae bacterium]|nr:hypothetical protein [Micromonosporaceae bacterium]